MSAAVFGDLLGRAEEHLQAAIVSIGNLDMDQTAAAGELRPVVTALGRYLDDLVAGGVVETMTQAGASPWERAAADARAALRQAGACLAQAHPPATRLSRKSGADPARHLAAAAVLLAAGRDLLHTHLATTPDGWRTWRSEWAPVLASPPVTRALTSQIARWARHLAPLAASLAVRNGDSSPALADARDARQAAAQWLDAVNAAVHSAQAVDPVTAGDLRLLHAIPAAQPPPRRPPHNEETAADLCAGITISAQRLRTAVHHPAGQARESPAAGADAWRWAARAAAVTGHASELALRGLASHPSPDSQPLDRSRLQAAADAVAGAWRAWRQVTLAWNDLTTELRDCLPSAAIELGDLLLRLGRLAYADPHWTPARTRTSQPRDPAYFAISAPNVIAAVHQATDALARLATADLQAVALAVRGRQLYVPTRTLPARYDVPRPYAPAPPDRSKPLLEAYRAARDASLQAADELATLAIAVDAPSSTLALARAAACLQSTRHPAGQTHQPVGQIAPDDQPDVRTVAPGPVEHAVRSLRVNEPIVLLRAAAIDTAAHALISQAEQMAGQRPRFQGGGSAIRDGSPSGDAARLAAQDHPLLTGTGRGAIRAESGDQSPARSRHEVRRTVRTPHS